jgi:hypothetical protein
MIVLTPAYGQDYKSKAKVINALEQRRDFLIASINHPYSGKPANLVDLIKDGQTQAEVRYNALMSACVIDLRKLVGWQ